MSASDNTNPKQFGSKEPTATRWVVHHSTPDGNYSISDNFLTEDKAHEFAAKQTAKGRIIKSVHCDPNFRLDF